MMMFAHQVCNVLVTEWAALSEILLEEVKLNVIASQNRRNISNIPQTPHG
jgi:hypothetical protein